MHSFFLSICVLSNSCKYFQMSWNFYTLFISDIAGTIFKMVYVGLMVGPQRLNWYITACGGKFLKRIETYLHSIKSNEINRCPSDIRKHVSYTCSHKRFLIHYGPCLETAGNVFWIIFLWFISIVLIFIAFCVDYTAYTL